MFWKNSQFGLQTDAQFGLFMEGNLCQPEA